MFIVIEGPDAVGKATQVKLTAERMVRLGRQVETFSFPRYETPLGKTILRHLKNEAFLCEADGARPRAHDDPMAFQCMMTVDKYDAAPAIVSHLQHGRDVICDRWWQSAYVYGGAEGVSREWLQRIHERLPRPDLNILISVNVEEAARRRPEQRDRYEQNRTLQLDVFQGYHALWRAEDGGHWVVIDGVGTVDEVNERIMGTIRRRV